MICLEKRERLNVGQTKYTVNFISCTKEKPNGNYIYKIDEHDNYQAQHQKTPRSMNIIEHNKDFVTLHNLYQKNDVASCPSYAKTFRPTQT